MFALPELINHTNEKGIRDEGLNVLTQKVDCVIDGSGLKEFDSSILAILLAWRRVNPELVVQNVPHKLQVLARVYGLTDLFQFKQA